MILTGRAKEDFENWLRETHYKYYLYAYGFNPDTCNHALIIEWFDSIGYIIEISTLHYGGWHFIATMSLPNGNHIIPNIMEDSRKEATKKAILKANQIYNESKN